MKKLFVIVFTFMLALIVNAEECSCGSHQTGIYDYSVADDSGGCCDGRQNPGSKAYLTTFVPGPGMTWIVRTIDEISFSDAIKACCPSV